MAKVVSLSTVQKQMSDHFRDLRTQAERGQIAGYVIAIMGAGDFDGKNLMGFAGLTLEERYELLAYMQAELIKDTIHETIKEEYE